MGVIGSAPSTVYKVIADAVGKAFDRLAEEHFKNRIVNITGE